MAGRKQNPRLLHQVIEALTMLQEMYGSTEKKIIQQVELALKKMKRKPRNAVLEIRKAINHGLESGIFKKHAKRIKLSTDRHDKKKDAKPKVPGRGRGRRPKPKENTPSSSSTSGSRSAEMSEERSHRAVVKAVKKGPKKLTRKTKQLPATRTRYDRKSKSRSDPLEDFRDMEDNTVLLHPADTMPSTNLIGDSQFDQNIFDQINMAAPSKDDEQMHNANECNNPNCICNLKKEPDDDTNNP